MAVLVRVSLLLKPFRRMTRSLFLLASVACVSVGPSPELSEKPAGSPSAHSVLDAGLAWVGGSEALRDVRAIRITFAYQAMNLGQEEWPGGPALMAAMDGLEIRDYQRPGLWTRYHVANAAPTLTRVFVADSAGFAVDTLFGDFFGGTPRNGYDLVPAWHNDPARLLRAIAIATNAPVRALGSNSIMGRWASGVEIKLADDTLELWTDAVDHRPLAIERRQDDPITGLRVTRIALSNWVPVGRVRLPFTIVTTSNNDVSEVMGIVNLQVNPPTDSVFDHTKKVAGGAGSIPPKVVELTPGVFRLEGSINGIPYNPVAVQQGDSIILLETPVSDVYTRAILDTLRTRFPKTPVKAFVVSHHHADHVSGVRTAFNAGLSGIAPVEIADYVRRLGIVAGKDVAATRHLTVVRDTLAVGTGPTRFILYHVPTNHARGLMMAYFPETRVLWEVDLAAGSRQDRRELYDFVQTRKLPIERLARIHGEVSPWETFVRTVPGISRKGP
jgi:hypothetical protein